MASGTETCEMRKNDGLCQIQTETDVYKSTFEIPKHLYKVCKKAQVTAEVTCNSSLVQSIVHPPATVVLEFIINKVAVLSMFLI